MADDANSYALNLAFQLQTVQAITGLGDILQSVTEIQKGIKEVSTLMSTKVAKSTTIVQQQFAEIAVSTTDISKTTLKLNTTLTETSKTVTTTFEEYQKITLELEKQRKEHEKIGDLGNKFKLTNVESAKQGKEHAGIGGKVAAVWHSISNWGKESNQHAKEGASIGEQVAATWHKVGAGVKSTVGQFASMVIGVEAVRNAFAGVLDEEVRFSTANYRLYGSQRDLITQVNDTRDKYGLMRKQVLEAYVAIGGSVRGTKGELEKMVATNVMFSNILGQNQKDIGNWQRSMKSAGFSVTEQEAMMTKFGNTMRNLGLTIDQMRRQITDMAKNASKQQMMWGKEGIQDVVDYSTTLVGLANKLGASEVQSTALGDSIQKVCSDPKLSMAMQRFSNLGEEATKGMTKQQAELAHTKSGYEQMMTFAAAAYKKTESFSQAAALTSAKFGEAAAATEDTILGWDAIQNNVNNAQKAYAAAVSSGNTQAILETKKNLEEAKKYQDIRLGALMGEKKALEEVRLTAKDNLTANQQYAEYAKTMATAWKTCMGQIDTAWNQLFVAIQPAIMGFIDVVSYLLHYVAKFINFLSGRATPDLGEAAKTVDKVTEAVKPATSWFGWLGDSLAWVWSHLDPVAKGFTLVAVGFMAVGAALVGSAVAIGMLALLMRVANVPKLLAIAVAAVAVGAGFMMMAAAMQAMGAIKNLWSVIGALAVMFVMLAVAVKLLMIPGTQVILVILAGSLLAISFAALMFSWAMQNVSTVIKELITLDFGQLWELGKALVVFGVELIAAAVVIGIGGVAITLAAIPLGVGMAALSVAMYLLSDSAVEKMQKLGDGSLQKFGAALGSMGPGIEAFCKSMGYGIEFTSGMKGLSAGVSWIDPGQTKAAGDSLKQFGDAIASMAKIDVTYLPKIGEGIVSFAKSLSSVAVELQAAIVPTALAITTTFMGLLAVIPVIASVTDRIATALQTGQEKIRGQLNELKASFVVLEMITRMFGPLVGATATADTTKKKVLAETISTVQVKSDTGGGVAARWEQAEMQKKQVDLIQLIATAVDNMTGGGFNAGEDVHMIKGLLAEHLPKLGESPSKLGTRMNNWS